MLVIELDSDNDNNNNSACICTRRLSAEFHSASKSNYRTDSAFKRLACIWRKKNLGSPFKIQLHK